MTKALYILISQLAINSLILVVLAVACNFLPDSPFKSFLNASALAPLQPYMKYINWFLPVEEIICILEVWVVCIAQYFFWELCQKILNSVSSNSSTSGLTSVGK